MSEQEFGSDGQVHPVATAEQGALNETGFAEQAASAVPFEASEPASAAQRLRAFEDEHLGPDAVRINDRVERGSGSPFQALTPEKRKHYHAIEKTIDTEGRLADARAKLAQAESEHNAAVEDASKFGG